MQELQKEGVRQQELIQKQQVPRILRITYGILVDLVKTAWDCGIFDRILYSKVFPFQITIPVALLTDVEFARMCILLFHIR